MEKIMLSKSKYLSGLQCPKFLWAQFHEPDEIPEPDSATQYIFDQGHLVGELAKKLYPGGIDIPDEDFADNLKRTGELLKQRKTLFEAGILSGDIYSRLDILNPVKKDEWDIIEVKMSTRVKEVNVHDVSFQKHCCEKCGLKIRKCFLTHINNEYVREGEIEPEQLFETQDITAEVEEASTGITERIEDMLATISTETCPDITIGRRCNDPYGCPLTDACWAFLPENSVFNLYYGGRRSIELFDKGVLAIRDIPDGFKLSEKQQIQKDCEMSGEPYINKEEIRQFLQSLDYPQYYLDFETLGPAVPIFDSTRPYHDIPFQFSLHVVNAEGVKPKLFSFLASGTGDPRSVFLAELKKVLGSRGSIIVYNQGFEEGILEDLGRAFPEYNNWVSKVRGRLVDLLVPFQKFHYYHPLQSGSASLKKVLPAVTDKSYEGMDISEGQEASVAFQEVTYGDVSEETRNKVRGDLEKYCALDTEGMLRIVDGLREAAIHKIVT